MVRNTGICASRRVMFIGTLAVVLALPGAPPASAAPPAPVDDRAAAWQAAPGAGSVALPTGWNMATTPSGGVVLTLSPFDASALEARDARPEFRLDGAVIGYPRLVSGRLILTLDGPLPTDGAGLSAWIGTSRLDAPNPVREAQPQAVPATPATAAAVAPLGLVDPAAAGRYATERASYVLDPIMIEEFSQSVEVEAEVISPIGAPGKRPLVMFLHGRHYTCYDPAPDPAMPDMAISGDWPCASPMVPIPSHQGYRYVAEKLASQGFMTVSISANGINGQDAFVNDAGMLARSVLTRHHLAFWEKWSRKGGGPFAKRFVGKVDMGKVVLVGHSRGGEGVERAAIDAGAEKAPYTITGLALIGPTSFGRQVAAGVHTAVLLPYCDGDVSDLQGQAYVDNARDLLGGRVDPAIHSAIMLMGTNHNFYNTEWTPGQAAAPSMDDWLYGGTDDDPNCGANAPQRLSASEQQAAGAVYIAALVRLAATGDQAVVPYLDGALVRAASAGRAEVFTHALGANHTVLYRAGDAGAVNVDRATADVCRGYGYGVSDLCEPIELGLMSPHFLPMYGLESFPAPRAVRSVWGDDGTVVAALPKPVDLSKATHVDVRIAVRPDSDPAEMKVAFVDAAGRTKSIRPELRIVRPLPPGGYPLPKTWAFTLRVDLRELSSSMRKAVAGIGVFNDDDEVTSYLLDISSRTAAVGSPAIDPLPRVDVSSVTVDEGDGDHTEKITISLDRSPKVAARVWVQLPEGGGREVIFQPGKKKIVFPVVVHGNTTWDPFKLSYSVTVAAISNVVTGRYFGGVNVIDDDPAPTLTVTPIGTEVAEGDPLTWEVTLSAPVTGGIFVVARFTVPGAGPELSTFDFSATQRDLWFIDPAAPDLPLSQLWAIPMIYLEPGTTTARVTFTPEVDGLTEGTEYFTGSVFTFEGLTGPAISGSVVDA